MENVIGMGRDTRLPQVERSPGISSVEITADITTDMQLHGLGRMAPLARSEWEQCWYRCVGNS